MVILKNLTLYLMMRIYVIINQNISSMCFLCNAIFLRFPNPAFVADKPLLFTKVLSFPNVELRSHNNIRDH